MKFSVAKPENQQELKALMQECFCEPQSFFDFYFQSYWDPNHCLIVSENDKIIAALEFEPLFLSLYNTKILAAYISGVRVLPQYRKRGICRKMMKFAHGELRKRGVILTLLTPFSYDFYRRMGYEQCYCMEYYEIACGKLSRNFQEESISKLTTEKWQEMNIVYQKTLGRKNASALRNLRDYQLMFELLSLADGEILGYCENGDLQGYIAYFRDENRLKIKELACVNEKTFLELTAFLSSKFSQYDKICIDAAIGSIAGYSLQNLGESSKIFPAAMAKVINISAAVKYLAKTPFFSVFDSFDEGNDLKKAGSIELDVRDFTRLFMGMLSPLESERFAGVFEAKENYYYDWMA